MAIYTHQIIFKVEPIVHDAVTELANQEAGGIISHYMRILVDKYLSNLNSDKQSVDVRLAMRRHERTRRKRYEAELYLDYRELLEDYDEQFEKDLIEFAEKHNLVYPPDKEIELTDYDPKSSQVWGAISVSCNGADTCTLREVQRVVNLEHAELTLHLHKLRDANYIDFDEIIKGHTVEITKLK